MEAMAAGVPFVATRIAGIPELVRDGQSGLLIAPGDVNEDGRDAVARLLGDAELRNRFTVDSPRPDSTLLPAIALLKIVRASATLF